MIVIVDCLQDFISIGLSNIEHKPTIEGTHIDAYNLIQIMLPIDFHFIDYFSNFFECSEEKDALTQKNALFPHRTPLRSLLQRGVAHSVLGRSVVRHRGLNLLPSLFQLLHLSLEVSL